MPGWFEQNGYVPSNGNTGVSGYARGTVPPIQAPAPAGPESTRLLAPTGGGSQYADAIQRAYRQYLGRDASPQELQQQLAGQNSAGQVSRVVASLQNSPEARAYQQRQAQPQQAAGPAAAPFSFNQASVSAILKQYPPTPAGLQQAFDQHPELAASGSSIVRATSGKIRDPRTGKIVDVGGAFGSGSGTWRWGDHDELNVKPRPGGEMAQIYAPTGGGFAAPSMAPRAPQWQRANIDPVKYDEFKPPDPFTAPTLEQAQQDPGYQFALNQGLDAISNRATAQGIRGGDVLKDFSKYASDQATTHYNDTYQRARDTYGLNFGNAFQANQANNAGRQGAFQANTSADLGYGGLDNAMTGTANQFALGQGQLALGNKEADNSYSLGQGQLALGNKNSDQSYGLGQGNLALGWGNYGLNANQQQFFQDYQFPISTGFNAANATGGYGSIYAQNAGNNAVGAANASGAAGMAGAGAWNSALGSAANAGLGAYFYKHPPSYGVQ